MQISSSWSMDNYEALLRFYIRILPKLLNAERCTIYIVEIGTNKIYSKYGTHLNGMMIKPPRKGSIAGEVISTGKGIIKNDLAKSAGFHTQVDAGTGFFTKNIICAPIKSVSGQGVTGAIQLLNKKDAPFTDDDLSLLEEVANYLSMSIENIIINHEILKVSDQLNLEVERLNQANRTDVDITNQSAAMGEIIELVQVVAPSPVDVLLLGENGSGKERIARKIHALSSRKDKPFIAVNCAAIPEQLVESELFGYEKGAFTGADRSKAGRFEEAEGGTLFLDEIADMPLLIQPKILRAIQEKDGRRLGSNTIVKYDFRIISATNKDLHEEVEQGRFREDLFFRLFSVEIRVPPLRERRDDIIPLADEFLHDVSRRFKKEVAGFSSEVLSLLENYNWPGNVRQLHKEVERLVVLTPAYEMIKPDKCSAELLATVPQRDATRPLLGSMHERTKQLEIDLITQALEKTKGNKVNAAKLLGITRQGLHKKIKRYNIDK